VKKHNKTNKVVTITQKEEQQKKDVAIASLEEEPQMTY
jgi:hypothetical protein